MRETCGENADSPQASSAHVDVRGVAVLPFPAKMRGHRVAWAWAPFVFASFVAYAVVGCAPQDGTGTSGGTSGGASGDGGSDDGAAPMTRAGKACVDMATVFATSAKRCGGNYDAEYAAFVRDIAGGDCNSVSIRNEVELRNQCFTALSRITCADLKENRFAPSCAEQIIRSR